MRGVRLAGLRRGGQVGVPWLLSRGLVGGPGIHGQTDFWNGRGLQSKKSDFVFALVIGGPGHVGFAWLPREGNAIGACCFAIKMIA